MQGKQYLPIPKLRLHKASGKAAVMLDGKYHYLGLYGSDEAQQRYDRMISEWLANRRTTTGTEAARLQLDKAERATALAAQCVDDAVGALTVDEVLAAFRLDSHLHAFVLRGADARLSRSDIAALMSSWNTRNTPALDDDDLNAETRSAASNETQREPHVVESKGKYSIAAQLERLAAWPSCFDATTTLMPASPYPASAKPIPSGASRFECGSHSYSIALSRGFPARRR